MFLDNVNCVLCLVESRLRELNKLCKINSNILRLFFKEISNIDEYKRTNIFVKSFEFIVKITGIEDPHREEKWRIYRQFLNICRDVIDKICNIDEALKFAINSNLLDVEMHDYKPRIENVLELLNRDVKYIDVNFRKVLDRCRQVCYILDNSGEHLFDLVLADYIRRLKKDVVLLVRELPYEIDVTRELVIRGIQDLDLKDFEIIEVPDRCPPILYAAREFNDKNTLIISKGIANFEAYIDWCVDYDLNAIFLLVAKCSPIAKFLEVEKGSGVCVSSDYINSRVRNIVRD